MTKYITTLVLALTLLSANAQTSNMMNDSKLTQLLRFILVFLANQRFVFLICFTVFYKF